MSLNITHTYKPIYKHIYTYEFEHNTLHTLISQDIDLGWQEL